MAWQKPAPSRRPAVAAALLLLAATTLAGCASGPLEQTEGKAVGTTWSLQLGRGENLDLSAAGRIAQRAFDGIDGMASLWKPDSTLALFNASAVGVWVPAEPEIMDMLSIAGRLFTATGGAFDITVAPLVRLWGFGEEPGRSQPPPAAEIERALGRVGQQYLAVQQAPARLMKRREGLAIDLASVAKGYAVDRAARALRSEGYVNFSVELGGEVYAAGEREPGEPWRIGVEPARPGGRALGLGLRSQGVASSGDYHNHFVFEGQLYSHILDPRTGWPVKHGTLAVTVVHSEVASADAWATGLLVLGVDAALELALNENLAVLFRLASAEGGEAVLCSPRMRDFTDDC